MNRRRWNNVKVELFSNRLGFISVIILIVFALGSLFAVLAPYDPNQIVIQDRLQPLSQAHFFGTDDFGRDYFSRALHGGRVSLMVGFAAMIIATGLGTTIGAISGYFGGMVDSIIMRAVEILMSIPSFLLMLILSVYVKPSIQTVIIIIGLLTWMNVARLVRAETLSVKEREYVLYAKVSGQSSFKIIFYHIIPSISSTIIVTATINIASAILMESALSFLGLGIQQPNSSWGSMLNNAQGYIGEAPHLALFPGLFILLTVMSFNVLGDVLRVAFEPKANDE
ncbi:ABC transporter permease [Brevibacillus laterosporus]|uniref:ABC transporter permease n=1 Tax=Brevibacillus laterosporus TaxID=1465 RepID=A0A518V3B6_BRELA|nr:ABC transporter permease [Brevibacillus laterosporus]QDX91492.1 ABC transporter permease [Brevibacillus laterosporus]TPG69861.1 ABC transporter permease [Brevibacillus laterosporus]